MILTRENAREIAERIIQECNDNYDYCLVYEDEDLEDMTEEEWIAIHNEMLAAKISVTWADA